MKVNQAILVLLCGTLSACAEQPVNDPLHNTKKLFAEGHATLYNNGAFEVPMTTIHIIPAGPGALDLAMEMGGMRARQSFEESVKHARESIDFAQAGIEKSKAAARAVNQGTARMAAGAREATHAGVFLAGRAPDVARAVASVSITYSQKAGVATETAGRELAVESLAAGDKVSQAAEDASSQVWSASRTQANKTSEASRLSAGTHWSLAGERFAKGYAALDEKLGARAAAIGESASLEKFAAAFQRSAEWRSQHSGPMTDVMVDTAANYSKDVKASFGAARREIETGSQKSGPTLALLKSLGWVVQGLFWDATIKPAGKLAGATVGYIAVNGAAVPVLIVNEGAAVANVAVQVTWNGAASLYDITAPTGAAALAGLLSAADLAGGQALAGAEWLGGGALAGTTYVAGKAAAGTTKVGGYLAGKTVQYIGVPLPTIGEWGGRAVGVVAGAATGVAGGGVAVAGGAEEAATRGAGFVAEHAVFLSGSAASVAAGGALGVYELSKAVVVPTGYALGSGVVLSYDTLAQLSAQTVLTVADASYMVLSLEGPNWVLYAVRGNLDKGDNLPSGTILDLKAMQQAGETFVAVPVSNEEMKRVVNSAPGQLPVRTQPAAPAAGISLAEGRAQH